MGDREFISASVWSDYTKMKPLGAGNFASVFLAEHKKNPGMMVAIKTCSSGDIPKVKVMKKEFTCLDKAQHDHIVDLKGGYDDPTSPNGETSLVLEYAPHGDLVTFLQSKDHRLTERRVQSIMRQLLHAVGFLHSNGYVHRDIKPHNILVVKKEPHLIVKLADFGLVKPVKIGSLIWARQNSAGDGDFLAPDVMDAMEQQMPVRVMEYLKNDVFALGCILYYLLSGDAPDKEKLDAAFDNAEKRFMNVSGAAIDLCQKMMHPKADSRISVEEAITHEWIDAMIGHSTESMGVQQSSQQQQQQQRRATSDVNTPTSIMAPPPNTPQSGDGCNDDEDGTSAASPFLNQGLNVPEESFIWIQEGAGGNDSSSSGEQSPAKADDASRIAASEN